MTISANKKVHFIGICGVGMSAVARLYQLMGWQVTGSDQGVYDPVKSYLEKCGLTCRTPHQASNLPEEPDLIVIGRHAKLTIEKCDEVRVAYERFSEKIISFPQAIQRLTQQTRNFVVVGSYGKSTCASLMTWILKGLEIDLSYFVGAIPLDLEYTSHLGESDIFVLEGDEYPSSNEDPTSKFMYYHTSSLLLTSAEHDHINVFPAVEDYLKPFQDLIAQLQEGAKIVACIDNPNVQQLLEQTTNPVFTYGFQVDADWRPVNVRYGETTRFDLTKSGRRVVSLKTGILGKHNVQNIVGVCAFLLEHGFGPAEAIAEAVAGYRGIVRRLDKKTERSSLKVYEGFGSSYTKARTAIEALNLHFPDKKLIVLFEPHTFSWRNKNFIDWYDTVFEGVANILLYRPPTHGREQHDQLSLEEIHQRVASKYAAVFATPNYEAMVTRLGELLKGDEVVLLLSSGSFDGNLNQIVEWMETNFPIKVDYP